MSDASASRSEILSAVRNRHVPAAALPDLTGAWITFPDRAAHFAETLRSVGGTCVDVAGIEELRVALQSLEPVAAAKKVYSALPEAAPSTFDMAQVADPHALDDADVAIARGEFAVAENGAVWVTDANLKHRVILFIAQHLVLVVPRNQIVNNMHEAYARLRFDGPGYGLFLSGPSKTADIEQSLVIGAHGPRSLTVYLLDGSA
ncbi:MAG: LUD domain-containing protein [Planctomycetia bacterium]|nr:LUD domain-containing protein [Planctomycetia bacterium]